MSAELSIVIPMQPPAECSPNSRAHWRKKAAAIRDFRMCAFLATRMQLCTAAAWTPDFSGGAVMDVEIAWCCGRKKMDDDNAWASLKPARDGIADVVFGGEDRKVVQGTLTQTRGSGIVTVTLRDEG
jgi:hypothetical protein